MSYHVIHRKTNILEGITFFRLLRGLGIGLDNGAEGILILVTHKDRMYLMNTVILCVVTLIGGIQVVRSIYSSMIFN